LRSGSPDRRAPVIAHANSLEERPRSAIGRPISPANRRPSALGERNRLPTCSTAVLGQRRRPPRGTIRRPASAGATETVAAADRAANSDLQRSRELTRACSREVTHSPNAILSPRPCRAVPIAPAGLVPSSHPESEPPAERPSAVARTIRQRGAEAGSRPPEAPRSGRSEAESLDAAEHRATPRRRRGRRERAKRARALRVERRSVWRAPTRATHSS
jgi:hypothetical protein